MDIQELEKENEFLKMIIHRDQVTNECLIRVLHELGNLIEKYQKDYNELKQKYDDLLASTQ